MCELAGVSRAGFYRDWAKTAPGEEKVAVRAAIQEVFLQHRRHYGRRRITWELRRQGMQVNPKQVRRLMRKDNLLVLRRRKYIVTTNSKHDLEVYLNVAAHLQPTGIDQLWVADITYIRLRTEFVFLAVVLDSFSRRVVGWSLERSMTAKLTIAALRQAIENRRPPRGLVHHSDRGIQYAAQEYGQLLAQHGIIASMSRPGNPFDNAACERFIKTLKYEEIHCRQYRDLEDLRAHLKEFIDGYYNRERLHSALGYQSPDQFERGLLRKPVGLEPTGRLSFSRHRKIYRSDVGGKTS